MGNACGHTLGRFVERTMTFVHISPDSRTAPREACSCAVAYRGIVYVSGQGPVDPPTGQAAGDSIEEQLRQTFENLNLSLTSAGSSPRSVRPFLVGPTAGRQLKGTLVEVDVVAHLDPPAVGR
jgi:hypothetical protein